MLRARLMASASIRWCDAHMPEMRRGNTLPRSGIKFCSSFTSLKSMMSTLSRQKRQTLRRRNRPRGPPRPPEGRPCGDLSSSRSKSRSSLLKFLDIILFLIFSKATSRGACPYGPERARESPKPSTQEGDGAGRAPHASSPPASPVAALVVVVDDAAAKEPGFTGRFAALRARFAANFSARWRSSSTRTVR